jgi:hypothetical protein
VESNIKSKVKRKLKSKIGNSVIKCVSLSTRRIERQIT